MIPSTFSHNGALPMHVAPYLTERERDAGVKAIDRGALVAVAETQPFSPHGGGLVALATPALANEIASRHGDELDELKAELKEAARELANLRTIIGEVMAEKNPREHDYRLHNAADDVAAAIKN